jgi:class 3 adenylate cyclase
MYCPSCGSDNPAGAKFCIECAAPLQRRCSSCGTENPPQAKFCAECGASLTEKQKAKGKRQKAKRSSRPSDSRLWTLDTRPVSYTPKHLADKILTTRSALEGERRQVTVLFADTAGFTALAEKLDPEDVHQILDRCFKLVTAAVYRFEGTINQYGGDGVMALFGAPIAHEDGPRRAVHAALAIQQALRDFN